ncbi:hypothetical protein IAD21_05255 [Abditibacteriota bacterium]|nr:hypothetical protein IAD21_05255 [Abditibacteriota bacterium]
MKILAPPSERELQYRPLRKVIFWGNLVLCLLTTIGYFLGQNSPVNPLYSAAMALLLGSVLFARDNDRVVFVCACLSGILFMISSVLVINLLVHR